MIKAKMKPSIAFLLGMLCFSCTEQETVSKATMMLTWPERGKTSLEVLNDQLLMLNTYEGNVYLKSADLCDSVVNCYDPGKPFEPEYLISLNNVIYKFDTEGMQSIYPSKLESFVFKAGMRYYRSKFIPSVKFNNSVYLQAGYNGPSVRNPENLIKFSQQPAVWRLTLSSGDQSDSLLEEPISIPKIPSKWSNGSFYGFTAYLTQTDDIGVFSYEKYPTVYLFDLQNGAVTDSFEFESLSAYGLEPLSPSYSIDEKRNYHISQPAYNAAFLHRGRLIRVLRVKHEQWVMAYDLQTGEVSKRMMPKDENTTIFLFNDDLLSIRKVQKDAQKLFYYIPFSNP